jgi:hypothetical protein
MLRNMIKPIARSQSNKNNPTKTLPKDELQEVRTGSDLPSVA